MQIDPTQQQPGQITDYRSVCSIRPDSYYIVGQATSNPREIETLSKPFHTEQNAHNILRYKYPHEAWNEQSRFSVQSGRDVLDKFDSYRGARLAPEQTQAQLGKSGVEIEPDKLYIVKQSGDHVAESISKPFHRDQKAFDAYYTQLREDGGEYRIQSGRDLLDKWDLSRVQQQAHTEQHSQAQPQPQAPQTGKAIASAVEQGAGYGFGM
ncbi:MAG: hypothetical protein FWD64_01450 [Acidobacteriaceae bacterium]|nr:hypothetical protein [Acidobacteriaceae bacterium]